MQKTLVVVKHKFNLKFIIKMAKKKKKTLRKTQTKKKPTPPNMTFEEKVELKSKGKP